MNQFLACAGIDGDEKSLKKLLDLAEKRKPEVILFAGGIANSGFDVTQKRDFWVKCLETLGKSGHQCILIPGPFDIPQSEFLRAAMNAEIVFPNLFFAHATLYSKGSLAICGLGGLITESEDSLSPTIKYSHTTAEYFLRSLWHSNKSVKILMLSEPPPGKLAGNGGNSLVGEFINSYHPAICIVGGEKQFRGYEKEKHGFVVNPGRISQGSTAWINWKERIVEILDPG